MNTHHGGLLPAGLALGLILSLGVQAQDSQHGHEQAAPDTGIPLFEGLGEHQFPITTPSESAQEYFDQGLMLVYGFNHFEAVHSFTSAARHDADCAMCHWGIAFALGSHINAPMAPDAIAAAHAALLRAQELAQEATEREQAYIETLSARYTEEPRTDRSELDQAYADAMRELADTHPDDLDAATLFAESLMNLVPWDYWKRPATSGYRRVIRS